MLVRAIVIVIPLKEIAHGAARAILEAVDELSALFKGDVVGKKVGVPRIDGNDLAKSLYNGFFPQSAQ
ncbi:unnamed protein product [marine sediment metagenome]|uniref:Uncharacterized protein n=1 Tax=marine sediment metagenome TaxID=412755 RepID=X1KIQ9_9ZZZZ